MQALMRQPTRPELKGSFGMVASTHWLASGVGMAVLERGGNAFDAAVAAGFVLQVAEPHLNGPGGDLPALIRPGDRAEVSVLCAQGPAPAAASAERFAELGLEQPRPHRAFDDADATLFPTPVSGLFAASYLKGVVIIGGTGRFANATGNLTSTYGAVDLPKGQLILRYEGHVCFSGNAGMSGN